MVGVEAHGFADALDAFFRPTETGEHPAEGDEGIGVVGVEGDRSAIVPLAALEIASIGVNGAQSPVTAAVASVEVDRRRGERQGLIQYGVGGIIVVDKYICEGAVGAGERIVGIEIDSLLKQFGSALVVVGV